MQDNRVIDVIKLVGLEGLFRAPSREIDHGLISALVERWWPETYTFHLPHGEMSITLEDMEVILGLPIDGEVLVGSTAVKDGDWRQLCVELLGFGVLVNDNKTLIESHLALLEMFPVGSREHNHIRHVLNNVVGLGGSPAANGTPKYTDPRSVCYCKPKHNASPQLEVLSPTPPSQSSFDLGINFHLTPPMHPETPSYPPTSSNAPTPGLYTKHHYPSTSSSSDPLGSPVWIDTLQPHTDVLDEHPPYQSLPPREMHKEKGSGLVLWPQRLSAAPPRLEEIGVRREEFQEDTICILNYNRLLHDTSIWHFRVTVYWKQMKSVIQKNSIRNVMDMTSNLGGFAAALSDKDVWVMNVAPVNAFARLKIIYDRGLIGTVHDWCEAFSTYPRTNDLLHAWTLFSDIDERGCGVEDLLIEMDRTPWPDAMETWRNLERDLEDMREYYRHGKTKEASWRKSQVKRLLTLLKEKEGDIFKALKQDLGKHHVEAFRDEIGTLTKTVNTALESLKDWIP
nr:putative methyltransferase pmt9 [Quercus suber]